MARPMVLAMPVSVSELSRHSMRAWMGKPSRSISCDRVAELRREVRPESEDAQFDFGMRWQVRAAASRDGCSRRARW